MKSKATDLDVVHEESIWFHANIKSICFDSFPNGAIYYRFEFESLSLSFIH
ncbi:hypothetical protein L0152_32940 [bacterium]|nr:hypothetical protein [bacterium]